ncbi:hypothetical protein Avbf_19168 [Armadillidium vulgare]|nr:hypothetical protein Avbf_19168 [Armadillidium vulgare]
MLKNLRHYSPGIEIKRKLKNILRISSVKCCYKAVTRLPTQGYFMDSLNKIGPKCHEISDFETVVLNHDAIVVFCDSKSKGNFYENVHLLVQDKGMVTATDEVSGNKLSVIIFGTDSVSRLNFHRVNPKTYNYLTKELNALEYGGYNKIGDNTLPNVLALSTGLTEIEFVDNCTKGSSRPLDNCPFIWKDFHRNGYITSFVEDSPGIAILSNYLPGFFLQPTDHYTRPGFLAAEEIFKNINECFGNKLTYEVLHAYSQDFEFTYQNRSTFSFIWGTGLTHDNLHMGRFTDEPHTHMLWLIRNLRENTLKFLTPFDIHETLLDIVHERYNDSSYYY